MLEPVQLLRGLSSFGKGSGKLWGAVAVFVLFVLVDLGRSLLPLVDSFGERLRLGRRGLA